MLIEVSGDATMQYAMKAKGYFMSVVNGEYTKCHVDLQAVDGIDLSFLEFLLSFQKTMILKNKNIEFGPLHEDHPVLKYLSRTGISSDSLIQGVSHGI